MATTKKTAPVEEEAKVEETKPAPKKKAVKATKVETAKANASKPTLTDFATIIGPVITEKSMALMQNLNQVTVKVKPTANKTSVKIAFERVFGVKVVDVRISNVRAKETSRGGRYNGKISGYKKAVVTIAEGEAIDLFKE